MPKKRKRYSKMHRDAEKQRSRFKASMKGLNQALDGLTEALHDTFKKIRTQLEAIKKHGP